DGRPLPRGGRPREPQVLLRLGALPRPARSGAGRDDHLAGRRVGEALPRLEAEGRAQEADLRHGRVVMATVEAISLHELCERFRRIYMPAVCDALYHLGIDEQVLPSSL